MKNIHIIPTDKPSRLILQTNGVLRLSEIIFKGQIASGVTQNIYITNNQLNCKNSWVYNSITKKVYLMQGYGGVVPHINKIILTTDQDLIKDGVQAIDDEFLEWFVKNPSCESVKVEKEDWMITADLEFIYEIIIPQEESKQELPQFGTKEFYTFFSDLCDKLLGGKPKQETCDNCNNDVCCCVIKKQETTLEEGFEIEKIAMDKLKSKWEHLYTFGYPQKPFPTNYENDLNNVKIGLCEGAKWQQEQIGKSEFLQKLRATLSDAEARRLIFETFKNK